MKIPFKIAFIGLGNMGLPMAANLVKAGHKVTGSTCRGGARAAEANRRPRRRIDRRGGERRRDRHHHAAGRQACAAVWCRKSCRRCAGGRAAHRLLDHRRRERAPRRMRWRRSAACAMLDAPVSGGVGGATAGTLTFMVGGDEAAFARGQAGAGGDGQEHRALPAAPGAGQAAKICNNMILGISMIAVCEAFVLAEKLGLSHQAEAVRRRLDLVGPVLVADQLLPGAGAGAGVAGQ